MIKLTTYLECSSTECEKGRQKRSSKGHCKVPAPGGYNHVCRGGLLKLYLCKAFAASTNVSCLIADSPPVCVCVLNMLYELLSKVQVQPLNN